MAQLIEPVINKLGYELWGYEFHAHGKRACLRVFIDNEAGITIEDCSLVSDQLSGILDVTDRIKTPYTLEVSSPGINRLLMKMEHFKRYEGQMAKLKLKWPIEGRRNLTCTIVDVDSQGVHVKEDDAVYAIPLSSIDQARLIGEL